MMCNVLCDLNTKWNICTIWIESINQSMFITQKKTIGFSKRVRLKTEERNIGKGRGVGYWFRRFESDKFGCGGV